MIEVAELTVKPVAAVAPNVTAVAPAKLVPVMVTDGAARRGSRCWRDRSHGRAGDIGELVAAEVADVPAGRCHRDVHRARSRRARSR